MKKFILSITLVAFAFAVQAGEAKTAKEKSACCSDAKAATVTKVKATTEATSDCAATKAVTACTANKEVTAKASCSTTVAASNGKCSAGATACKEAPAKQALLSPKAAAETRRL